MILVFRIMMLAVIVLMLLFCMSNLNAVTVKLLGWESPEIPLFLLLLFVFFFGFSLALVWQAWNNIGSGRPTIDRSPVQPVETQKKKPVRKWGRRKNKGITSEAEPAGEPETKGEENETPEKAGEKDGKAGAVDGPDNETTDSKK